MRIITIFGSVVKTKFRRGCLNPRRDTQPCQFLCGFVNISKKIPTPLKARVQTSTSSIMRIRTVQGLQGLHPCKTGYQLCDVISRHQEQPLKIKRPPSCFFRTDARAEPQGAVSSINYHCPLCCGVNLCLKSY